MSEDTQTEEGASLKRKIKGYFLSIPVFAAAGSVAMMISIGIILLLHLSDRSLQTAPLIGIGVGISAAKMFQQKYFPYLTKKD